MTVTLKEGPLLAVTADDGSIAAAGGGPLGLYVHDMRFLSAFELLVNGAPPVLLSLNTAENFVATFQLVNQPVELGDGTTLPLQTLSIRRTRFLADAWHERIGILNCAARPLEFEVILVVDADFRDIFAIRGYRDLDREPQSTVHLRRGVDGVALRATGIDRLVRETHVRTSPLPDRVQVVRRPATPDRPDVRRGEPVSIRPPMASGAAGGPDPFGPAATAGAFPASVPVEPVALHYSISLAPQQVWSVEVVVRATEGGRPVVRSQRRGFDTAADVVGSRYRAFLRSSTHVSTSCAAFDETIRRSGLDLCSLLDRTPAGTVPWAGIPWFATVFGRDALLTSFETLPFNPDIARGTLRFLAAYQGRHRDPETEEEPGRILHELRRGELARSWRVPHRPYYGTIDATPLFAWLAAEAVRWTGDAALWRSLRPHVEAALEWCETDADRDRDGFIEYDADASDPLWNKGWKDSRDSLSWPDGRRVDLPAALVEAQAYVYAARLAVAGVLEAEGDRHAADRLRGLARDLREHFESLFWLPEESCYAQALDASKRPVPAVTSNAGHALWAGLAGEARAALLAGRLLQADVFSGWGVRTLASGYATFNPMSYHNGSVWPHDSAIVAAGLARYGHRDAANRIVTGIVDAGTRLPGRRLPEVFCGFARDERFGMGPAEYLVSCAPHAWSAAAPFLLLATLLGIRTDAGRGTVVVDPSFPDWLDRVDVRGLRMLGRSHAFGVRRIGARYRVTGDACLEQQDSAP